MPDKEKFDFSDIVEETNGRFDFSDVTDNPKKKSFKNSSPLPEFGSRDLSKNVGNGGPEVILDSPLQSNVKSGTPKKIADFNAKYGTNYQSVKEFTTKAKEPTEGGSYAKDVLKSMYNGAANLSADLYKAPRYLQRNFLNIAGELAGMSEAEKKTLLGAADFVGEAKQTGAASGNILGSQIKKQVKESSAEDQEEYSQGIIKSIEKGNFKQAGKEIGYSVAGAIPTTVGIAASALAGVPMASWIPAFGAGFYDEVENNPEMSENKKQLSSLAQAGTEVLFESLGTGNIAKVWRSIILKEGPDVAAPLIKKTVFSTAKEVMKKHAVLTSPVVEGLSEGATQFTENIIKKETDPSQKDLNVCDGVWDAVIVGGAMGGGFAGVGMMAKAATREKKAKLETEIADIDNDIEANQENPQVAEPLIAAQQKKIEELNDLQDKHDEEIEGLPDEVKEQVLVNAGRVQNIEQSLQTTLSETGKAALEQQAKDIEKETTQLIKDAKIKADATPLEAKVTEEAGTDLPDTGITEVKDETKPKTGSDTGADNTGKADVNSSGDRTTGEETGLGNSDSGTQGTKPVVESSDSTNPAEAEKPEVLDLKKIEKQVSTDDLARFQQLSESLQEGELLLKENVDASGAKLTAEKRSQIERSVQSTKNKILELANKVDKGLPVPENSDIADVNTVKGVKQISEDVASELKNRGLEGNYTTSENDFGESAYFTFYVGDIKHKVRISDHSVESNQRMRNEIHYPIQGKPDPTEIANTIERLQYPERYEFRKEKDGRYIKNGERGNYTRKNVTEEPTSLTSKKGVTGSPGEKQKTGKKLADKIRQLADKSELKLTDESGNEIKITKSGLSQKEILYAIADLVEKGGEIIDAIREVLKDEDWYKNLSEKSKSLVGEQIGQNLSKNDLSENDKSNLKKIEEETGVNFRKIQNFYETYGDGKPLSEITTQDFLDAQAKREEGKPPPEGPEGDENGNPNETSVKHAETAKLREEIGIPEYEKKSRPWEVVEQEANELLQKGYNIAGLIERLKNGHLPSDTEQVIMRNYLAGLAERIATNPTNELIAEATRAIEASDRIGGSEVGRSLAIRKTMQGRDETLMDFFVREVENNQGAILTENQKGIVQKEFEEIMAAKKALEDKLAQLETENNRLKAEAIVKSTKQERTKKTHTDYVSDRQKIASNIKEKLKKFHAQNQSVIIPYAAELVIIAPDVAKLVKSYVDEAIDKSKIKLSEVVSGIHEILKEGIPEITESDVVDLIAGKYNTPKPTRSDAAKKLIDLKQQAKLILRLESLQKGEEPKSEKRKIERNREVADLSKQIKEHDLTKLAQYKKRVTGQIEEIEEQLRTGDFAKEDKNPSLPLDAEAKKLKDRYIKLKQDREIRILKEQYANRTKGQKFKDFLLELANAPRTLKASLDYSAPLRQGLLAVASHPIVAWGAFKTMFRHSFSQKEFDRWFNDVQSDQRFSIAEAAGLYIANPLDPRLTAKEEQFMNNIAEKIPVYGTHLVKGSERAYVGFLNKMRWDLWNNATERFIQEGKTIDNSPQLYKALASYINNSTGRGALPDSLKEWQPALNAIFFSPRLLSSRLKLLTDFANPNFYRKVPREVRKMYFADMAKMIGVITVLLSLAALGNDDDDKVVELDPRSSDFLKIKIGKTRYDVTGGFQQPLRYAAQAATGQSKNLNTGDIMELDGKGVFGRDRWDVMEGFGRSKLSPLVGTFIDIRYGTNMVGEPVTWKSVLGAMTIPLIYSDVADAWKEQGVKSLATVGLPAMFGVGVSTFGPREDKYFIGDEELNVSETGKAIQKKINTDTKQASEVEKEEQAKARAENDIAFSVTEGEKQLREVVEKSRFNKAAIITSQLEQLPAAKRQETFDRWVSVGIISESLSEKITIDDSGNIKLMETVE